MAVHSSGAWLVEFPRQWRRSSWNGETEGKSVEKLTEERKGTA